jgi:hypothetical protein
MPEHVTIPRGEYQSLLREVKRGAEVCGEISNLRITLLTLSRRLEDPVALRALEHAIESCEEVSRLRIEFFALERRLREFDSELTPIRPPSRTDIQAAFDNANDYAQGKRKPPG